VENRHLKNELNALKERLALIEQLLTKPDSSSHTVLLTNASLEQNVPNPFTENTRISYYLPEGILNAELRISNASGKLLRTITINHRGQGQTTVQAHSLAAGTYLYTLMADGQIIGTRKMILTTGY